MERSAFYYQLIRDYIGRYAGQMLCEPDGILKYPYIVPGSRFYSTTLWDWDSWLCDLALHQYGIENPAFGEDLCKYELGCLENFADHTLENGYMPIVIPVNGERVTKLPCENGWPNMHKPVFAQHAAFLMNQGLEIPQFVLDKAVLFADAYAAHSRHEATGLYFWQNDYAIGVDNDPCTFFRPEKSSGSILLNSFMYRELLALGSLFEKKGDMASGMQWKKRANALKAAVSKHCFDERDGSFYSVDLDLLPNDHVTGLHSGAPRTWDCLLMRYDVWSNILPLWAGIATAAQADAVMERFRDPRLFNANYGVRSLSAMEKMYDLSATNNPSNWLGPVWGAANYLSWRAMVKYGYLDDAEELAEKTVRLIAQDILSTGTTHEYYHPDTGEGILTPNFVNWNALSLNMSAWLKGDPYCTDF